MKDFKQLTLQICKKYHHKPNFNYKAKDYGLFPIKNNPKRPMHKPKKHIICKNPFSNNTNNDNDNNMKILKEAKRKLKGHQR